MAKNGTKKPKAKSRDDSGVLASLPTTRPQRIGGRRRGGPKAAATTTARAATTSPRRKPAAKKRAAVKPRAAKPAAPQAVPIGEGTMPKPKAVRSGASGLA